MGARRDAAVDEHTHNILMGLSVLDRDYGLRMDEFDYLDAAITHLKDIKNFGTTEYLAILKTNSKNEAVLPCNIYVIDAVTTVKMGFKSYNDRVRYTINDDMGSDTYHQANEIMQSVGREPYYMLPGSGSYRNPEGYYSYQLEGNKITINRYPAHRNRSSYQSASGRPVSGSSNTSLEDYGTTLSGIEETSVAVAFTGISTDAEGYPMINVKQATALAALMAKTIMTKRAIRGDKHAISMLEFLNATAVRLKQAASIPENISDNEIDELMDAHTSFHRKKYRKPTKYSR